MQRRKSFILTRTNWSRIIPIYGVIGTFLVVFIIGYLLSKIEFDNDETFEALEISNAISGDDIEREMQRRLNVVEKTCKKFGFGKYPTPKPGPSKKHPPTPLYEAFYFDRMSYLAWCPTYKAGSTTWLYNFALLGGKKQEYLDSTKLQLSEVARDVLPSLDYDEGQMAFNKSRIKFFIVRHPFERLLSAFRDKFENISAGLEHGTKHFYLKYGSSIVGKYRKDISSTDILIYNGVEKLLMNEILSPNYTFPAGIEPTFSEFIQYINDHEIGAASDDHWMPYYMHCTPCLIHYDAIAKLETMRQDQEYILRKSGSYKLLKPRWKHLTKGEKSSDVVEKYFSTLTKEQLLKLYNKYIVDFEMFEYSINEYLNYVI